MDKERNTGKNKHTYFSFGFIGFCVVQRARQSVQYIREGKGKRVSFLYNV